MYYGSVYYGQYPGGLLARVAQVIGRPVILSQVDGSMSLMTGDSFAALRSTDGATSLTQGE